MRLLITGALGHIGSRFIHALCPGVYDEVVLLDDLSTQRYCSLFGLPDGVPFRFIEADICTADLNALFASVDLVIHLAAVTDAVSSFDAAEHVDRVNFDGTRRVAEACVAQDCSMIFVSTTSVYGTTAETVDEACSPEELKPQSPYANSKLRAERFLSALAEQHPLRFVTCRFGTIFGTSPGMRFHTAINKFIWQACTGHPLTVWRSAMDQTRPFLDIRDAVRALEFIIRRAQFDNGVYNVLTESTTVRRIVEIIGTYIPDIAVDFVDSRIMNQLSYEVCSGKFRALGFRFCGSLDRGIRESVEMIGAIRHDAPAVRAAVPADP